MIVGATFPRHAMVEGVPAKDWVIKTIVDRGPGLYYRYHVRGTNLNYPPEASEREFAWSVPTLDDPRYDLSGAITDNPTHKARELAHGDRFRYAGYPDGAVYEVIEAGRRYCLEKDSARSVQIDGADGVVKL
jgi:hypothetical protein